MTTNSTRREFLRRSSQTASLLAATGALGGVQAYGAERPETVTLGLIGCGGIMAVHARNLAKLGKQVSVAWLCDVDPRQAEKVAGLLKQSAAPKRTQKFEDVLADRGTSRTASVGSAGRSGC